MKLLARQVNKMEITIFTNNVVFFLWHQIFNHQFGSDLHHKNTELIDKIFNQQTNFNSSLKDKSKIREGPLEKFELFLPPPLVAV